MVAECCVRQDKAFERDGEPTRSSAIQALDEAVAAGLTVIRTWFFQDSPAATTKLQPQPGMLQGRAAHGISFISVDVSMFRYACLWKPCAMYYHPEANTVPGGINVAVKPCLNDLSAPRAGVFDEVGLKVIAMHLITCIVYVRHAVSLTPRFGKRPMADGVHRDTCGDADTGLDPHGSCTSQPAYHPRSQQLLL